MVEAVAGMDGVRKEIGVGLAATTHSPAGSRRHRVLVHDAAGRSPQQQIEDQRVKPAQQIDEQRRQNAALQACLDQMSALMLQ